MGRAFLARVALVVSILAVAESAAAQAIIPVSRLLHCEASASDAGGTVNHNPPDVSAGATSGLLNHNATATSPMGSARGSSSLSTSVNLTPNTISLSASASGQILGPFTPLSGGASATGQIVVDFPQDTEISHRL